LISVGALVPDEVVEGMIENAFDTIKGVDGFLLDGFPRTLAQAEALDAILAKRGESVTAVVSIMIPDELIYKRIEGRALIEGRADDADRSIIKHRIDTYHSQTEPLIAFYKEQGKYYEVDVTGDTIEENRQRVLKLMETIE
ncbi:MAG: nucleoside monophosphate kinase, partial [Bacteroidales bacterium]|nr:nucleoside monophosphate kinase [Bacteroidales bacterium]